MSKRIKLKFKKMLKKAEFVHADLDYHEELLTDAKVEFNEAFLERLNSMSRREKKHWKRHVNKLNDQRAKELLREAQQSAEEDEEQESDLEGGALEQSKEVFIDTATGREFSLLDDEDADDDEDDKLGVIKKLYRKIASATHPDKLIASDLSPSEISRKEKAFIRAKEAYERENWYSLYSVASDLGITPDDIEEKHIEWVEDDIRLTMGRISRIGQLFTWVWYVSDEEQRKQIIDQYLKQVYDWEWKD